MCCDQPQVYLLPGMTADYPVYSRVMPLLANAALVPFIEPRAAESLNSYATRMADSFHPDAYIVGVSFGGVLAVEISRIIRPKGCIIVSSIRNPRQMPPWFRWSRILGGQNSVRLLRLLGEPISASQQIWEKPWIAAQTAAIQYI